MSKLSLVLLILQRVMTIRAKDNDLLNDQPMLVGDQLQNFTVRVGNDVTFACTVEGLGNYRVAWLHSVKGTLAVHPHVITQNNRISVSHDNRKTYLLQLKNVKESDAGKYICQLNTGPPISIRGMLNVVVPPDIVDDESSSEILATEGTRVELRCKAHGNPTPKISWKREDHKNIILCRDGKKVSRENCREVEYYKGPTLILPEVSRFDSGNYLCLASNGVPPIVSKRVKVHVEFPPNMWIIHQLIGVETGGTAILECLTAANPTSLNFWIKDGPNGAQDFLINKGRYILEQIDGEPSYYNIQMKMKIVNVTKSDFGNYTCMAKNPQGQTNGKILLYEIHKPKPSTTPSFVQVVEEEEIEVPKKKKKTRNKKNRKKTIKDSNDEEDVRISNFDLSNYKKKEYIPALSTSSTTKRSSRTYLLTILSFYIFQFGPG